MRTFLIWTQGYAGESRRLTIPDGADPRSYLATSETVAHEIKPPPAVQPVSLEYARAMTKGDNT